MTDRYGLPYMGSKSKIARWVVERLPEGDTLYDVFCGGCAITDYAMRMRKYGRKRDLTKTFDYDKFYSWCEWQSYENKNPVFISSYDLSSDKFRRVAFVEKGSSLHGGMNYYDDKIEGLYVPKEQVCDLVDYVQVKLF